MALAGFDYTEPVKHGRLDAWPDRQAPGDSARANQTAESHSRPAEQDYRAPGNSGQSKIVEADHLEYWYQFQSSDTMADAAVSGERRPPVGELHRGGSDEYNKSFRNAPVAWTLLISCCIIFIANLMFHIGAALEDERPVQAKIVLESEPDFFEPPIWKGVSGR